MKSRLLPFGALSEHWRTKAQDLRRYGAVDVATALEACAAEIEAEVQEYMFEELTLDQAAEELGVSYDTMSRRIRRGEIPNAGRKGKPLVRRSDIVPTTPVGPRAATDRGEPDIAAEALIARV